MCLINHATRSYSTSQKVPHKQGLTTVPTPTLANPFKSSQLRQLLWHLDSLTPCHGMTSWLHETCTSPIYTWVQLYPTHYLAFTKGWHCRKQVLVIIKKSTHSMSTSTWPQCIDNTQWAHTQWEGMEVQSTRIIGHPYNALQDTVWHSTAITTYVRCWSTEHNNTSASVHTFLHAYADSNSQI